MCVLLLKSQICLWFVSSLASESLFYGGFSVGVFFICDG